MVLPPELFTQSEGQMCSLIQASQAALRFRQVCRVITAWPENLHHADQWQLVLSVTDSTVS